MKQETEQNNELIPVPTNGGMTLSSNALDRGLSLVDTLTFSKKDGLRSLELDDIHQDSISSIAFSHDGKLFATASWDGQVYLWDYDQKQIIQIFKNLKGKVKKVSFVSNGKKLITVGEDRSLCCWDLLYGLEWLLDDLVVIAISPNYDLIALTSEWGTGVQLFDLNKREIISSIFNQKVQVLTGSFSTDSKNIITGGRDGSVVVWNMQDRSMKMKNGHTDWVWDISINSNSTSILSCGADGLVQEQDLMDDSEPTYFIGHERSVYCAMYTDDDQLILSGGADGTLRLWDRSSAELIQTHSVSSEVLSIALNENDQTVVVGCRNGKILLFS